MSRILISPAKLSFDDQRVSKPGYNADRGPVNFFGLRLHAEI
jgi:high affinity Mn2+ porin